MALSSIAVEIFDFQKHCIVTDNVILAHLLKYDMICLKPAVTGCNLWLHCHNQA